MRQTEAIEEMNERNAGSQSCKMSNKSQILSLLHTVRRQQSKASLPHRHDILVITEDGQGLTGKSTSSDMENRRHELSRNLVHVGNHEQKACNAFKM